MKKSLCKWLCKPKQVIKVELMVGTISHTDLAAKMTNHWMPQKITKVFESFENLENMLPSPTCEYQFMDNQYKAWVFNVTIGEELFQFVTFINDQYEYVITILLDARTHTREDVKKALKSLDDYLKTMIHVYNQGKDHAEIFE